MHQSDLSDLSDKFRNLDIKPDFERVGQFAEGLTVARISETWGYINKTGEWGIRTSYVSARNFSEGLAGG